MSAKTDLFLQQRDFQRAVKLLKLNTRIPIVRLLTNLSDYHLKAIHRHLHGRASSSGQLASNEKWFFKPLHQAHASCFLTLHRHLMQQKADPCDALGAAWVIYSGIQKVSGQSVYLPIDRAWWLLRLINCNKLKVVKCKMCSQLGIVDFFAIGLNYKCPVCDGSLDKKLEKLNTPKKH